MTSNLTARTKSIILREARKDWADLQRTIEDWNAMADECQRQGYRPQYCIHGTNTWTDYDNICWGCEDSDYPQDKTFVDVLEGTLNEFRRAQKRSQDSAGDFTKMSASMRALGFTENEIADNVMKAIDNILGRFKS